MLKKKLEIKITKLKIILGSRENKLDMFERENDRLKKANKKLREKLKFNYNK